MRHIKKCCTKHLHLFIVISLVISILCLSSFSSSSYYDLSFAQKDNKNNEDKDDDKNKLVVKTRIHLNNIDLENTRSIRVAAFINGEDIKQDIPVSSIDKTKILNVDLKADKNNDIVDADTPDEFFVCAYQVKDVINDYNSFTKFDCNESDLVNIDKPTIINLFRSGSMVYAASKAVYDEANLNKPNGAGTNTNDKVKIKISAPLADKKNTDKLKIAVMIKGQIQSEVIEDVQAELDKSDDDTISRTFTFERKTDIGLIQIGDRYHACVSSEDLRPPEGTECEKRIIKNLDKVSGLYAR